MLSDEELLRYSRHILLPQLDIAGQLKLKQSKVLIVGLGGLGSPVALYLAAAGVGELHLADFDTVDSSNLQRQILHDTSQQGVAKTKSACQRLQQLNPLIKLVAHEQQLDKQSLKSLVANVDLVMDCSDNFSIRDDINAVCLALAKPWISAAAIGVNGQLTMYNPNQPDSPCYRCLFPELEESAPNCNESGVLGPLVGTIGSLQAVEALKFLSGFGRSLVGRLLLLDLAQTHLRELALSRDPACPSCGEQQCTAARL